jgi:hypothetical protein
MTDGGRFRILAVVDDCTRECLALVADISISGTRVARELDRIIAVRGRPKTIVSDNGTELTSGDPGLVGPGTGRLALHRTGQVGAECLCRKLLRSTAR